MMRQRPNDRGVHLHVRLPWEMADRLAEIQRADPDFLRGLILAAVVRREIYEDALDRGREREAGERGR